MPRTLCLLVGGLLCLVVIGDAKPKDRKAPTIRITQPTTGSTYSTPALAVTISGTASDNWGVTQVTWSTDRGQSGTASGTTQWRFDLTLGSGVTRVTVRAFDAAGHSATASLTITVTVPPPPPPPPSPVSHTLAWDYHIPVPAQVAIDQCVQTAQGCPWQQIAVLPGTQQQVDVDGLSSTSRYCWVVRSLDHGEVSNQICSG